MNRVALIAVVLVVALGAWGLRFFGGADELDQSHASRGEWTGDAGDRGDGRLPMRRGQGFGRGGHGDASGALGSRPGGDRERGGVMERRGSGSGPGIGRRDGGPDVVGGRSDARRGVIGRSVGGGNRAIPGRSAKIIDRQGGSADRIRRDSDRSSSTERLAALPSGANKAYDDDAETLDAEQEEEEGTLFDPLAPEVQAGEVDRGEDEDPLVVDRVDFLEDGSVYVGADSVYKFPAAENIRGDRGTIDMTIVPDWNGADESTHSLLHVGAPNVWENRIRVIKNGEHIRLMLFDNAGVERNVNVPVPNWQAGERHQISASWDDGGMRLFLDGQLAGETAFEGEVKFYDTTTIELGSTNGTSGPAATYESVVVSADPTN